MQSENPMRGGNRTPDIAEINLGSRSPLLIVQRRQCKKMLN